MSPRRPVVSLKEVCLRVVAGGLEAFVRSHLQTCVEEAHWHVDPDYSGFCPELQRARAEWRRLLPAGLREELLAALLAKKTCKGAWSSSGYSGCCQCACFVLLFDQHVKRVHVPDLSQHAARYFAFLARYSVDLSQLRLGSIKSYVTCGCRALQSAFRQLHHVQTLSFSTCLPVDDLLQVIGENCWNLRCLDLGLSRFGRGRGVTERSVRRLCFSDWQAEAAPGPRRRNPCCDSLQVLSLGREDFFQRERGAIPPAAAVALLLRTLPNLQALPAYPRTGEALLLLQEQAGTHHRSPPTSLQRLWDSETDLKKLAAINRLAPDMKEVVLRAPREGVCEQLHLFQGVTHLMLTDLKPWATLSVFLQLHGKQLVSLQVYNSRIVVDLTQVSILCPKLSELVCDNVQVQWQQDAAWQLPVLRSLGLSGDLGAGSEEAALQLLPRCPRLERVSWRQRFLRASGLDDRRLEALLDSAGGFPCLESLWLASECRLSKASVWMLVTRCKRLRILGSMRFWKLVSDEEVALLRQQLHRDNWDVQLWGDEEVEDASRHRDLARVLVYPEWLLPL